MFSAQCGMGNVCVWLLVREWGTKGVTMTSQRLSWRPNRLPATAFKVALCVLHYHRAPQTWTMDPCCNKLYAWPRFLTYIYNLHAYITKNGSPQAKTSCVTASVVRAAHNCGDHCHSLPLEHSSSLSAHLIWSTVCLLTVDTTVPQQPCRMCARRCSLSVSPHSWHRDKEHCLQIPNSISPEKMSFSLYMHSDVLCCSVCCTYELWNCKLWIFLSTTGTPRNSWITSECPWKLKLAVWGWVPV